MISRFGNKGFFAAHYELVALGIGVAALAAGAAFYVMSLNDDPDAAAAQSMSEVERMKPSETGVKDVDMARMHKAVKLTRNPVTTKEVADATENFLTSERMVRCMNPKCGKVISPVRDQQKKEDGESAMKCRYCGTWQEEERKIVLDTDGDGMPDKWELRYKLDPRNPADASADSDGDGFTNLEEYQASAAEEKNAVKYDPTDKASHPSYLDSLTLSPALKEKFMPFIFTAANKIPAGWRCEFFLPKAKDASGYGRKGNKTSAVIGEEIGGTGYVLRSYEKKEAKRAIKGGQGLMKTVDVSEIVVERKEDGKKVTLVISESLKEKPIAVDIQATLTYSREGGKTFEVVPGSEIVLSGTTYAVKEIKPLAKGAEVVIKGKSESRTLKALEQ